MLQQNNNDEKKNVAIHCRLSTVLVRSNGNRHQLGKKEMKLNEIATHFFSVY